MEDELDEEYDNKNELKELLIALVKELDEFRQLNRIEEDHQVQLLMQLS